MKAPRSNRTGSGGVLSLLKISFGKPVGEEAMPYSTETTGQNTKCAIVHMGDGSG